MTATTTTTTPGSCAKPPRVDSEQLLTIKRAVIGTLVGLLTAIAIGWAGWVSLQTIDNERTAAVIEDRQKTQYAQLRDDIAEVKTLLTNGSGHRGGWRVGRDEMARTTSGPE
jgi:hypothetical protein